MCSTVIYSLLSACAACQLRLVSSRTFYRRNCETVYSQVFLAPIPPTTSVPSYAYLDVIASDNFNIASAIAASGESPASSATKSPSISITKNSDTVPNTNVPTPSDPSTTSTPPAATDSTNNNSKVPIIAAAVGAAGVVVAAIIGAGCWRGCLRRQGKRWRGDKEIPLNGPSTSRRPASFFSYRN
ncbi:hypothetical protein K443DRAFT_219658 [Laccaria amethystina LaAM-08-1]|uniref:Mid2 domain-containing protein n=1 Tax=Laccaria amethystina LaAM-08-1 TaxID=1095629 RepID=A0A0C9XKS9_9AGAR|nr:hypothetical protein K443DRAFT_219658 [Laccaria amethystina LaAM-08-1]